MRPNTNIALQGSYTFNEESMDELIGEITRVEIAKGQAILRPMLALNPSDLASFGSDLSLYLDQGKVAVAFPINAISGAAYAMRPGDLVDVLMSVNLVDLDPEFNTAKPNVIGRALKVSLADGTDFLFDSTFQGRLELIPEINVVAEIVPGTVAFDDLDEGEQIPKRITQLTIQQAEVLWLGTYVDPRDLEGTPDDEAQENAGGGFSLDLGGGDEETAVDEGGEATEGVDGESTAGDTASEGSSSAIAQPTPEPLPERLEDQPDVVILSVSSQDALTLKWALEVGININFVLRSQGDTSLFTTTSVSLPQIIQQGGLKEPEPFEYGVSPRTDEIPRPFIPQTNPNN
jgi:hypothetical protein